MPSSSTPSSGLPDESKPKQQGNPLHFQDLLKRRFLAGLIVVIPVAILLFAINFMLIQIDNLLGEQIRGPVAEVLKMINWPEELARPISITFSIILLLGFIVVIGGLTRFLIFRQIITIGEFILSKLPLVGFFYHTPKEVMKILTENKNTQKRVVFVQYPRDNTWVLGYATSELWNRKTNTHYVCVFIPTTPNPTSGFMLLYDVEEVFDVNITTEDAVRMIISGGILSPKDFQTALFNGLKNKPIEMPPCPPLAVDEALIHPNDTPKPL